MPASWPFPLSVITTLLISLINFSKLDQPPVDRLHNNIDECRKGHSQIGREIHLHCNEVASVPVAGLAGRQGLLLVCSLRGSLRYPSCQGLSPRRHRRITNETLSATTVTVATFSKSELTGNFSLKFGISGVMNGLFNFAQ